MPESSPVLQVQAMRHWMYNAAESWTGQKRNREQHHRRADAAVAYSAQHLHRDCGPGDIIRALQHMPLQAGTRLGPYEIQSPLGAGGMGEVYRARDTRLERTVAVKILPAQVAGDVQFRERFEHEARTISQLDHPHICALYDVGEQNGAAYLVMPYLEGETLADRVTKGALPLDQALQIAIQMADALATAHKAGIVHRDLKP